MYICRQIEINLLHLNDCSESAICMLEAELKSNYGLTICLVKGLLIPYRDVPL